MPKHEDLLTVAGEWVHKAENDLKNAAHCLLLGREAPTDTICFHAQQCAEKYLKALMVMEGLPFPKTHNLETLISFLPVQLCPDLAPGEQSLLTDYATGARYPGWDDISLTEARRAVALARRVRKFAIRVLPKEIARARR